MQNRYMQQMAANAHQQQMMGMLPQMNMQGMQHNTQNGGARGYPGGYMPQYMPNQQNTFGNYGGYPPMNYFYPMQNYQQNMMMTGQQPSQQQNSKHQPYTSQKLPIPAPYMMPPH